MTEARATAPCQESLQERPDWTDTWRDLRDEDVEQVTRHLSAGGMSVVSGGILARFEKRFARFAGTRHAVAFNNGTASIYAALWACGVGHGDDVLLCDYGFHGMAAAVLALGARVVPVDCRAGSLTMSSEDLARARTPRSRAILVHSPWGVPADFAALRQACPDLPLVSDASHAHGATYRGKPVAAWADVTCFSLGVQKLITGGELGCAVTDDALLRDRCMVFGHTNRVPKDLQELDWTGNALGLKLRPHAVALALAYPQIPRFEEKKARLQETCGHLEAALAPHGFVPQVVPGGSQRVWWRIVLRLDEDVFGGVPTEAVEQALRAAGLPVEPNHYWPLLQDQPLFQWPGHQDRVLRRPCPVARAEVPRLVTLPAPVALADTAVQATAAAARGVARSTAVPRAGG